ncbi:MAG: isopenicillin-N epimerase [Phycisphaerales bacterium]|jgi:isopenicillin-N epimerase
MPTRREFLGSVGLGSVGLAAAAGLATSAELSTATAAGIAQELRATPGTPQELATDEDYWRRAQTAFTVDRSLINFNNGGVSPAPAFVQEAMKRHLDFSNQCPPYNMWRVLEPQREAVRQRLARAWGVDTEEIAFTRNASESLQIAQLGFDLNPGDEVLCTNQAYPRMVTTFNQRARREGIVLRQFSIPVPAEDDAAIVRLFEQNITDKTRLILVSHVINLTGQILPVKQIIAMARTRGIPVIVDGAHAFANMPFTLAELGVDYYGTSLHKWLFAPHGTGLLYVKRDKIKSLWPMMAADDGLDDNIRKFEQIGTHPAAGYLAIGEALTFHEGLGPARKFARLIHLRDSWIEQCADIPTLTLHTSQKPGAACGIANVQLEGIDSADLNNWLWRTRRILCTVIKHAEFEGVRVSPSVYTTPEEIGRFADAMHKAATDGIG